jgi:hypothetical protein
MKLLNMNKSRIFARSAVLSLTTTAIVLGCGSLKDAKKDEVAAAPSAVAAKPASKETSFQLKGASLLSQHSESTFGPKMDLVESNEKAMNGQTTKTSIFSKYQNNFGTESGLKIEDKFSDAPTEAYFLALAIAGDSIARNCEADATTKGADSKCYCGTEAAAKELLKRSMVKFDFDAADKKEFITIFAKGCKANYRATIGGLINSLAFVQR